MSTKNYRKNLNPSLAITFGISAITGLMLLFHVGSGGIKHVHEWMSVIFVILGAIHLMLNWKAICSHFKNGPVTLSFVAILLLSVVLFWGNPKDSRHSHGRIDRGHAKQVESAYRNF